VFAVGVLLLLVRSVCAETDALMHAAGFALTESGDVDTKVYEHAADRERSHIIRQCRAVDYSRQ
jgi:hypothetical protein